MCKNIPSICTRWKRIFQPLKQNLVKSALCMSEVSFCLLFFLQRPSTKSPFLTSNQSIAVRRKTMGNSGLSTFLHFVSNLDWVSLWVWSGGLQVRKIGEEIKWLCRKVYLRMQRCLVEGRHLETTFIKWEVLKAHTWHLLMGCCCGNKYIPRQYILLLYSQRMEYPHILSTRNQSTKLFFF